MNFRNWMIDHRWLTLFVGLYTIVFGALALRAGNIEFVLYTGAMVVYIVVIVALDVRVRLSKLVLWCLAAWGLLHMAGGTVPIPESVQDGPKAVLYAMRPVDWLPRYDQLIHTFGFFTATLVCSEALRRAISDLGHDADDQESDASCRGLSFGLAAGATLMGMGLGAFNEVVEFAMDRTLEETGVGGYVNTGWDLVSNMVGALIGGVVSWRRRGRC